MNFSKKLILLFLFLVLFLVASASIYYKANYSSRDLSKDSTADSMFSILEFFNQRQWVDFDEKSISPVSLQKYLTWEPEVPLNQQKLIVHFWASWCEPCVNEIPELLSYIERNDIIFRANKSKIIFISLDYNKIDIARFLKAFPQLGSNRFLQIWDNQNLIQTELNIDRLPSTYILHGDGQIEKYLSVVNWSRL